MAFCTSCGTDNAQGASFCKHCGTTLVQLEAEQPPLGAPKPARNKNKRIIAIACLVGVAAIAVLLAVVLGGGSGGGGGYTYLKTQISYLENNDGELFFVVDGVPLRDTVEEMRSISTSRDNKCAVVRTSDNTLYYVSDGKVTEIAEDVVHFSISSNGAAVCYWDDEDVLYLYQAESGKAKEVSEDAISATLSPSGSTLAYVEDGDLFLQTSGEPVKIDSKVDAVRVVSDGGKQIYYLRSGKLYFATASSDGGTRLASDFEDIRARNEDNSEILYLAKGKLHYVNAKGEDISLGVSEGNLLFPRGAVSKASLLDSVLFALDSDYHYNLYYLNAKGECERIVKSVEGMSFAKDGKTLYYIKSGSLYQMTVGKEDEAQKLASDVESVSCTPDGKTVYYIDEDGDLYSLTGKKDPVRVATDAARLVMTHDGVALFSIDDDALYACQNGKDKERLTDDWEGYYLIAACATYYKDADGDVYAATKGTDFTRIIDGD